MPVKNLDFQGKTVLVAGGSSGINLGIAQAFADSGANLYIFSRSAEKVEAALADLRGRGGQAEGGTADVRDFAQAQAQVAACVGSFGALDVVVSGAAGNFPALASGLSPNGFKAVMDIDLLGTFHVMKAVYPHLKKPGARVINISAPQAFIPMEAQVHVCAAKAGVDMITRTLAMEWGPEGIAVNSLVPGPIEGTEGMKRLAPTSEIVGQVVESVPLRRLGTPEDVAQFCLALASDLGAYVSGAVIPVDGGWSTGGAGAFMASTTALAKQLGLLRGD